MREKREEKEIKRADKGPGRAFAVQGGILHAAGKSRNPRDPKATLSEHSLAGRRGAKTNRTRAKKEMP
jgi:hypothetical protein